MLFEGFREVRVDTAPGTTIDARVGGDGPPVLLLHGYPQTRAAWHRVAPRLARRFTVVVPDLRGVGRSRGPVPTAQADDYTKRAMATDARALMRALGFERFDVAGHDRGARVAYRLALDAPEAVRRLVPIDIVPTLDMWEKMGAAGALRAYHWAFLAQPPPVPETMIGHDPLLWLHHLLGRWKGRDAVLDPEAVADYEASFARPEVIAATCADYRAGATLDVEHDRADRAAARRIAAPVLVIWAKQYLASVSPLQTWRAWCDAPAELALDCGHFVAEERPDACAAALETFFGD